MFQLFTYFSYIFIFWLSLSPIKFGFTPLYKAAANRQLHAMDILIAHGANVNATTNVTMHI
jgi:hypothetical protein